MFDLPEDFIERMKGELGVEFNSFIESYDRPVEKGVRVNTLKISTAEFEKISPVELDGKVRWEGSGYYANGESLGKTVLHAAGLYYVQEPSAMCAVPELDVKAGERVLDLCAAPGGKTTQIAQYMHGEGILVANEIDFRRYTVLKSNIERFGVRNAAITCQSPENLAAFYKNYFDKILVDAPCSGEGMFKKEEAAVREWSLKNVYACAARQTKILESANTMLAGGGRLVYSTCTFSPDEDELQIKSFLRSHPVYRLIKMKKLMPHKVRGEGHFCAVLEKTAGERAQDFRLKPAKPSAGKEFDIFKNEVIKVNLKNVDRIGDTVYSLIDNFPAELKAGVRLGEIKNDRFEPAHSLAMCLKPNEFKGLEADEETAVKYLRGLTFDCAEANGWRVVTYKGFPLGWCKVVNGTAKNHLPKGIRI